MLANVVWRSQVSLVAGGRKQVLAQVVRVGMRQVPQHGRFGLG